VQEGRCACRAHRSVSGRSRPGRAAASVRRRSPQLPHRRGPARHDACRPENHMAEGWDPIPNLLHRRRRGGCARSWTRVARSRACASMRAARCWPPRPTTWSSACAPACRPTLSPHPWLVWSQGPRGSRPPGPPPAPALGSRPACPGLWPWSRRAERRLSGAPGRQSQSHKDALAGAFWSQGPQRAPPSAWFARCLAPAAPGALLSLLSRCPGTTMRRRAWCGASAGTPTASPTWRWPRTRAGCCRPRWTAACACGTSPPQSACRHAPARPAGGGHPCNTRAWCPLPSPRSLARSPAERPAARPAAAVLALPRSRRCGRVLGRVSAPVTDCPPAGWISSQRKPPHGV